MTGLPDDEGVTRPGRSIPSGLSDGMDSPEETVPSRFSGTGPSIATAVSGLTDAFGKWSRRTNRSSMSDRISEGLPVRKVDSGRSSSNSPVREPLAEVSFS